MTFNTALTKSFRKAFSFCGIQRVFDIAIGFEAVLIFAELHFGEVSYLGFREQTVEYLIAQIVGLAIEAGKVAKDIEPLVVIGL